MQSLVNFGASKLCMIQNKEGENLEISHSYHENQQPSVLSFVAK